MSSDPDASPFNSVPPAIVLLALAIFLVELALSGAARGFFGGAEGVGWRAVAIQSFAFYGPVLDYMIEIGGFTLADIARFLTYSFVHVSFTHVLFVLVFLLALGKMVAETVSPVAALVVFFGSAAFGALAYAALTSDARPLVGGFPAVYGLIGAFTFLLWARLGAMGEPQHRAFGLIAVLLGLQLVFGLIFGGTNDWVAEVAGFAFGFAVTPIVAPGGFRHLLARLRER
ncbi:MAG: rhomboid family intramembrane serine protease [Paracoccaceae bacterium]|nr:rhomboid family intramembrane serine protease [Paracoccaceae bacterium]